DQPSHDHCRCGGTRTNLWTTRKIGRAVHNLRARACVPRHCVVRPRVHPWWRGPRLRSVPTEPSTTKRKVSGVTSLVMLGSLLAVLVAVVLLLQTGGTNLSGITGLRDPGPLTTYGVTVVRLLAEVSAVVVIGSLLLAAFLVPPQRSGVLAADGYGAVRTAGVAAWLWVVFALASSFFSAAESAGRPVQQVLDPEVFVVLV